jgi:2-polyprenyl-3-methyl-5-hydroxy-6-metoxy-1,4-benzoquinol methylase
MRGRSIMKSANLCSVCESADLQQMGRLTDGDFIRCRECGSFRLIQNNDLINKNETSYSQSYRENYDPRKAENLLNLFRQIIPKSNDKQNTLLDMGCGDGDFIDLARKDGWDVCGLDSDRGAITNVERKGIRAYQAILGTSVIDLGQFSIVTLWDILEHIDNLPVAMNLLQKTVMPGGKIIVLTPDTDSFIDFIATAERILTRQRSQKLMNLCLNRYHLNRFSKPGLIRLFRRYGFIEEKVIGIHMFSLKSNTYASGFAPGIQQWTASESLNKFVSNSGYQILRLLNIKNKIFYVGHRSERATTNDD